MIGPTERDRRNPEDDADEELRRRTCSECGRVVSSAIVVNRRRLCLDCCGDDDREDA